MISQPFQEYDVTSVCAAEIPELGWRGTLNHVSAEKLAELPDGRWRMRMLSSWCAGLVALVPRLDAVEVVDQRPPTRLPATD